MSDLHNAFPQGAASFAVWSRTSLTASAPDFLAEEVPVALVYNGISHVVMMASPKDLELFAIGFSLSEGIIEHPREIYGMDVVSACNGLEVQIELSSRRFMGLKERRRALAGRTGCGVCGVEQLNDIGRPVQPLPFTQTFNLAHLDRALMHLNDFQPIGQLTGCTHAAAWVMPSGELAGGHEDVGRHVALDKLLGRRATEGEEWRQGAALVSSARVTKWCRSRRCAVWKFCLRFLLPPRSRLTSLNGVISRWWGSVSRVGRRFIPIRSG